MGNDCFQSHSRTKNITLIPIVTKKFFHSIKIWFNYKKLFHGCWRLSKQFVVAVVCRNHKFCLTFFKWIEYSWSQSLQFHYLEEARGVPIGKLQLMTCKSDELWILFRTHATTYVQVQFEKQVSTGSGSVMLHANKFTQMQAPPSVFRKILWTHANQSSVGGQS